MNRPTDFHDLDPSDLGDLIERALHALGRSQNSRHHPSWSGSCRPPEPRSGTVAARAGPTRTRAKAQDLRPPGRAALFRGRLT